MTYEEIVAKVAEDVGLSKTFVDKTYKAYWKAVREYIESIPLKGEFSEEDFDKIRPNVNIPSIGKLYITKQRFKKLKEEYNRNTNLKEHVAH